MFRGSNKTIILLFTALTLTLFPGVALALDRPVPYGFEQAEAGTMHGGYGMTGDVCRQCHDINISSGNYALSRWRTVTDICGSCHYLYTDGPPKFRARPSRPGSSVVGVDGDNNPRKPAGADGKSSIFTNRDIPDKFRKIETAAPADGAAVSVGSPYSAYEYRGYTLRSLGEHGLQRGPGRWLYTDKPDNFQGADYMPGGSGKLRAEGRLDYPADYSVLNYPVLPRGLYCGSCHIPHGDAGPGLSVGSSGWRSAATILAVPQVLTGLGNSGSRPLSSLTTDVNWGTDDGRWCAECHNRLFDGAVDAVDGSELHNHPDFACLICHADAVNDPSEQPNTDFPHTGYNSKLLAHDEDSLCVNCHVPGSLP